MSEISERLSKCIDFLIYNGQAKSYTEVAKVLGVSNSALSMAITGYREPSLQLMVSLCDHYPVNLAWLRTGKGGMIAPGETPLLQRIAELEETIRELKERLGES